MTKVIVDQTFWELFPEAELEILAVEGIDNHPREDQLPEYQALLDQGKEAAKEFLTEEVFSQNSVVQDWRQAFQKFKTKKGARSSIEALLKRVDQDREFTPILPLVDLYNAISLTYGVPCGGEDIDQIQGDMHLGMAQGGESFYPLGAEEDAPALPGEICYLDQAGAICRCFNWREAQRTMLQAQTERAVLVIEAINPEQVQRARQAIVALQESVAEHLGVSGKIQQITADQPQVEL
ncbi:B3/B4 domain-containing protein [Ignavigranum ruoffiae]|uniref:B3/B4 domain-containing protein (DNA/RNA-binding domain of Phe-tRNA-synthetase) n=1 Tax=Ignavigranum ruoffiae TaxID=89093 RepID=A0A1H9G385_9LACT|nr:phenylalanine--tRNA ligase beta subunit-related protein [Ignavigranum ruoffiae]SEQ44530.1 B3/B4 domain-containing protein (DNA/RNA-binding domain of Phe-tRNA-synthetase) [Ignavigranum ruoffiae]